MSKASWILWILPVTLTACFGSTTKEEFFYHLHGPRTPVEASTGPRLLVTNFSTAAGYDTERIAYRLSAHEIQYYGYRQWVSEPGRMITETTIRLLRASGKFSEVGTGDKLRDPDLVLEAMVDVIEEVDKSDIWQARLSISFVVRRGDNDKVLIRHVFDKTNPCTNRTTEDVAKEISNILSQEVHKLTQRITRILKKINA